MHNLVAVDDVDGGRYLLQEDGYRVLAQRALHFNNVFTIVLDTGRVFHSFSQITQKKKKKKLTVKIVGQVAAVAVLHDEIDVVGRLLEVEQTDHIFVVKCRQFLQCKRMDLVIIKKNYRMGNLRTLCIL